jgi:hypothetical protein
MRQKLFERTRSLCWYVLRNVLEISVQIMTVDLADWIKLMATAARCRLSTHGRV